MSKIKNALTIAGISLPLVFGANKVLAQDSNDFIKNKNNEIEMSEEYWIGYNDAISGYLKQSADSKYTEGYAKSISENVGKDFLNIKTPNSNDSTKQAKTIVKENRIYSNDQNFGAFLGGVFGAQIQPNVILTPDYKKDFGALASATKDSIKIEFLPATKALKNANIYLTPITNDSSEAAKIINYQRKVIKSKLEKIADDSLYNSAEYGSSLKALNNAVKNDGIIEGKELFDKDGNCKVADGLYVLNYKSKNAEGHKANSFPVILNIESQKDKNKITMNVYGFPAYAIGFEKEKKEVTFKNEAPVDSVKKEVKPTKLGDLIKNSTKDKYKSIILGGHLGIKGIEFGYQNGNWAGIFNISKGSRKGIGGIEDLSASSSGMSGSVEDVNNNYKAFGASFEYHFSPEKRLGVFIAGGGDRWTFDEVIEEITRKSNGKTRTTTKPYGKGSTFSGKVYGGIENKYAGFYAGYCTEQGRFAGLRGKIPLNKGNKRK